MNEEVEKQVQSDENVAGDSLAVLVLAPGSGGGILSVLIFRPHRLYRTPTAFVWYDSFMSFDYVEREKITSESRMEDKLRK